MLCGRLLVLVATGNLLMFSGVNLDNSTNVACRSEIRGQVQEKRGKKSDY